MKWVKNTPTKPGKFWAKDKSGKESIVELRQFNPGWSKKFFLDMYCIGEEGPFRYDRIVEWAGPLKPPKKK